MSWQYCAPQSDQGTEWEDILRKKGILDPDIKEDELVGMVEQTVEEKLNAAAAQKKELGDMSLDELNNVEDDVDSDDEKFLEQYRRQRIAEIKDAAVRSRFGNVLEISKADWKREVNDAGADIAVVVLITRQGLAQSKLLEECHRRLAAKFPQMKFVKGEAENCIPNYPDKNIPTVLLYKGDSMLKQWVGFDSFGGSKASADVLEWLLSREGVLETELESDPRDSSGKQRSREADDASSDDDDW